MSRTFEPFVAGMVFPEAPRWHGNSLWLSDIHAHHVVRYDAAGNEQQRLRFDDRVCGLGFAPDGAVLVVSMLDRLVLSVRGDHTARHADLSSHCAGFLLDMVVDASGHAYVGARNPPAGSGADALLLARPDGSTEVVASSLRSPNGSVVSDDGRTLIVAETSEARLTAFTIESDGRLRDRRVVAHVPGRHPDGICIDAEGGIWFGSPLTEELVRVDTSGEVTHTVATPGWWAVACALGGPDGHTLYCVVGRNSVENLQRLGEDRDADVTSDATGEVWVTRVDVPARA